MSFSINVTKCEDCPYLEWYMDAYCSYIANYDDVQNKLWIKNPLKIHRKCPLNRKENEMSNPSANRTNKLKENDGFIDITEDKENERIYRVTFKVFPDDFKTLESEITAYGEILKTEVKDA